MALQYSVTLRNAQLDQVETVLSTSPKLQIRTGAPPADCATADSGTLLVEIDLPSDWMSAASAGTKAKSGTWSVAAVAAGTAGHFRLKLTAGSPTHVQGNITATAGGGDMTVDNVSIAVAQVVTVNTFSVSASNA